MDGSMEVAAQEAGWRMSLSPVVEVVPQDAVAQGIALIERWAKVFPGGGTWVAAEHGVPTLIARIDGVLDEAGELRCYEIEERPCGVGVTAAQQPRFKECLEGVMASWPALRWVDCPERKTDDHLWLGEPLSLTEARRHRGCLLVRSRPEQEEYHELEDRAVSSVSLEGTKAYGETFGWWRKVSLTWDAEEHCFVLPAIPPGVCVFKPLRGTRSHYVRAWASVKEREALRSRGFAANKRDFESLPQLLRLMQRQPGKAMYCQPLVEPMRLAHQPGKNAIVRIYYAFDLTVRTWVPLGGIWMALDSLIVHGTDRTITGPLELAA